MPRFGQDPIYTGEQDAPELLSIPLGDVLSATASEVFSSSPTPAALRAADVSAERTGREGYYAGQTYFPAVKPKAPLTTEQAQAKIDAAGLTGHLTPTPGDNEDSLQLLIDYKTKELGNKFILDRYRGGIGGGAAQLATSLAVSLADPVNIGAAFMPVFGEARYAQILGRAGTSMTSRALARTGVGAVEGTVGAAVVEPIIYQSKQAIQADYDAYDSLANIGFGGVFGGALQPAARAVADVFARRARTGAWAENVTPLGDVPESTLPEGWVAGGGTRYIDGDDYVRGQFAVVDASTLPKPEVESFAQLDPSQVFESPYSDSGAPVFGPDGTLRTGSRRLAAIADTYASGNGEAYRAELISNAERYGLDSEDVDGLAQPVLVRTETSREVGKWAQDRALYEKTPQARARFANPDEVVRGQFRRRARALGVTDEAADALAPSAARDSVTGFYDGRTDDAKAALLERAQRHVAETSERAVFVSGDVVNLGGLNAHVGNRAELANVHFRAMADLMREELESVGGDVVPMRTGGDELGAVVIGADEASVLAALERARSRIADYAETNQLAEIPHPKRSGEKGVGMHFGTANIDPRLSITEIANAADAGVDLSKQGIRNVRTSPTETTGAGTPGQRPSSAATGSDGEAGRVRPQDGRSAISARTGAEAGEIIDRRIAALEELQNQGRLTDAQVKALNRESDQIREVLRLQEARDRAGTLPSDPRARLSADERRAATDRLVEISRQVEGHRAAVGYKNALDQLQERLSKIDTDAALIAEASRLSPVQQRAALQTGIAQAVNGSHVNVLPASLIDGTRAGAERFLEAQRIADEAVATYRQTTDARNRKAAAELVKFDPAEGEALAAEVRTLEASLRREIKDLGGDASVLDDVLAEVDQLAEDLAVESKALRGTALCMLRGG